MTATVAAIYRYPVKGLSAESLDSVALIPGECLPHDRRFAIALGSTLFDPQRPEWLSKIHFVMLMRDEKLAQLQTRFDAESGVLTIAEDGRRLLRERMTETEGRRLVAEFFTDFLGPAVNGPLRVVEAPGHAFADARRKPNATTDKYVSLINRASIAALEAAMGVPVDPLRFRANVYFDGASAWSEHDWIDSEIVLGRRAAAGGLAHHQMRGNPGQSGHCETRSRHCRRPRTRLRPHQHGRLRRGSVRRRSRHRRCAARAAGQLDRR
jgi:uncharacterized protein